MTELAGERRLVQELGSIDRAEFRIAKHLRLDRLQRDFLAGKGIAREIDGSGRALAEELLDVVFANLQAEIEGDGGFVGHVIVLWRVSLPRTVPETGDARTPQISHPAWPRGDDAAPRARASRGRRASRDG